MVRRRLCWLALLAGSVAAASTAAQMSPELPASPPLPPTQTPSEPGASSNDGLPPYEPQLERLASLMGTLAYLRDLCGKGDGADWRNRMNALLESEAKTQTRRERLAGAYNRGFRGYEVTYRACTPSAELVIARAIEEGDRLTRDLSSRYGGG